MARIERMAFSAERVRPGLPMDCLSLLFHQLQTQLQLPQATANPATATSQGVAAALWRFRAKPGKRGQEGGVGLFNRPNWLTQSTSTLFYHLTVCIVETKRRLKSGAEVPDF